MSKRTILKWMLCMVWPGFYNFFLSLEWEGTPFDAHGQETLLHDPCCCWRADMQLCVVWLIISVHRRWIIIDPSPLFAFVVMRLKLLAHLFSDSGLLTCLLNHNSFKMI